MTYDFILAIDPSGSFYEGKGCTGWCILESASERITLTGNLYAKKHTRSEEYWQAHLKLIDEFNKRYQDRMIVVIEDYLIYAKYSQTHINSRMETSRLIGIIQYYCFKQNIPYAMQLAVQVKNRWTDEILQHKGFLIQSKRKLVLPVSEKVVDRHCRDSIRHAVHYHTFKNRGEANVQ